MKTKILIFLLVVSAASGFANPQVFAKKYLKIEDPVILDCGANDGRTAGYWKKCFPKSLILAVEADPQMAALLTQNTKNEPAIRPFHLILSDIDGLVEFYPNIPGKGTEQGSIYKQSKDKWYWPSQVSRKPILVPSKKLDTFCKDLNIAKIDFLFLDMQGGELQMLKASKTILPQVSIICTEVFFEPCYEGMPLYPEVHAFLTSKGFVQVGIHKKRGFADVYYVKSSLYTSK